MKKIWVYGVLLYNILLNHATWGKKTKKTKKSGVVWDLSLEIFYIRLFVWIKFKFVLNYC